MQSYRRSSISTKLGGKNKTAGDNKVNENLFFLWKAYSRVKIQVVAR